MKRFKDIEKHFQDAADHQKFEFDDQHWDALSERLDNHDRTILVKKILLGVGTIVLLGCMTFILLEGNRLSTSSPLKNASEETTPSQIATIEHHDDLISSQPKPTQDQFEDLNGTSRIVQEKNKKSVIASIPEKSKEAISFPTAPGNSEQFDVKPTRKVESNLPLEHRIGKTEENHLPYIHHVEDTPPSQPEWATMEMLQNPVNVLVESPIILDSFERRKPLTAQKNKSWEFSVYGGPDWSSTSMDEMPVWGHRFGVEIGRRVSNKLIISTGLRLSQKKLRSQGSAFHMEDGWVGGLVPTEVKGKCNILEIPVMMNYYLKDIQDNSLLISLGFNSYHLNNEWYGFSYDKSHVDYWNCDPIDELTISRSKDRFAGVMELGIGYQYHFGKNLYGQIKPSVQIPLNEIGEGGLMLYSYGLNIGMKFRK